VVPPGSGARRVARASTTWRRYGGNMVAMRPAEMPAASALDNAVAVATGKGGVGKTSITANVAGTAALSGWRVLAVDLDPQGNLGNDLGYNQRGDGDEGGRLVGRG
jgi:Mrp family chromosome partitioning ATPase